MIPQASITAWRKQAPWIGSDQVEHDLVLSRAICELYQDPIVYNQLIFRGGTALHKLFFNSAGRFSEDLDFVQREASPIGDLVDAIRSRLDYWLGSPSWKQNEGRFTLYYRFETEIEPVVKRKVKIEINTREHFNVEPLSDEKFVVVNKWFSGQAVVHTYSLEELLATKLRALYQRKKGRDLYDFWYSMNQHHLLDYTNIVNIFHQYMKFSGTPVSRAEFEQNIYLKRGDRIFNTDIEQLLSGDQIDQYNSDEAYNFILKQFVERMAGLPWKGVQDK